jgi:hypothetical protein
MAPAIAFTGTRATVAEFETHGRSEAAIHRWDLVGDDDIGEDAPLTTDAATGSSFSGAASRPAGQSASTAIRESSVQASLALALGQSSGPSTSSKSSSVARYERRSASGS